MRLAAHMKGDDRAGGLGVLDRHIQPILCECEVGGSGWSPKFQGVYPRREQSGRQGRFNSVLHLRDELAIKQELRGGAGERW